MLFRFIRRKASEEIPTTVTAVRSRQQQRLANYLQAKSERLPASTKKVLLVVFSMATGAYCTYLVLAGFIGSKSTPSVDVLIQPRTAPLYLDSVNRPESPGQRSEGLNPGVEMPPDKAEEK